jgi:hypothetical protein
LLYFFPERCIPGEKIFFSDADTFAAWYEVQPCLFLPPQAEIFIFSFSLTPTFKEEKPLHGLSLSSNKPATIPVTFAFFIFSCCEVRVAGL